VYQGVFSLSYSDFVGQSEVRDRAKAFVLGVTADGYKKAGMSRLKGLVITGEKGVGKTHLAKIIASELDADFIPISANALMNKNFWGKTSEPKFFDAVKKKAETKRVVVAIDQFGDLLQDDEKMARFKSQLECIEDVSNVVIVGEMLKDKVKDDFLWDSGFEKLSIEYPKVASRQAILRFYLRDYTLEKGVSWSEYLGQLAKTFVPKEFGFYRKFTNEVGRTAVKNGRSCLKKEDFEAVLSRMGAETKRMAIQPVDALKMTAVHEAGHVLMAVLADRRVFRSSILPVGDSLGVTLIDAGKDDNAKNKYDFFRDIVIDLGGACAEEMTSGALTKGAVGDFEDCTVLIKELVNKFGMGDEECEMTLRNCFSSEKMKEKFDASAINALEKCKAITRKLLRQYSAEHAQLSKLLFEKEQLSEQELYAIVGRPREEMGALL
jgi:ATP-dependent Zn protease